MTSAWQNWAAPYLILTSSWFCSKPGVNAPADVSPGGSQHLSSPRFNNSSWTPVPHFCILYELLSSGLERVWVLFLHRGVSPAEERGVLESLWGSASFRSSVCPWKLFPVVPGTCGYWGFIPQFSLGAILRCCLGKSIEKTRIRMSVVYGVLDTEKGLVWRLWEGSSCRSGNLSWRRKFLNTNGLMKR